MKRMLALALAMLLALGCCAAFAEAEPITLNVIIAQYGPNTENWFLGNGMDGTNFVAKFEEANPDIKLNLEVVSWNDLDTVVSTRISNNSAPDILNNDNFSEYVVDGLLLPVSDYCTDELFADFFPSFIEQSIMDDVCWAVPDLASARALYVNTDILAEVGIEVPTTWAELEDACQAIVDFYNGDVYPWGIDMTTDEGQAAFSYYVWNNDGGFLDADGNLVVNSDKNVEAIEYAIGLYNKGFTNPNPATQTRYDLQDATAALPVNEGAAPGATGVMDRIMAFKNDAYPDQAARNEAIGKFLSFFYAPENYVGWVSMEGFLPAVNSSVAALVESDPSFQAWLDVLDSCKFYPTANPKWDVARQGVIEVEQQALTGGDVKALLDDLQAKIDG